jgi:hypothetical protein
MTSVGHLVATDVRRFKWLLLAWLALEVAATVLTGVQPAFATNSRVFGLLGATNLLWLIEFLLFVLLVPLIVQADPLVTTDAFWMTRPIPPRALLTGKALLVWTALALVPILVESTMMIVGYRVPLADALLAVFENVLVQTFALAILMTVASLTPTLSTFVLVWVGALFTLALVSISLSFFIAARSASQVAAVSVSGPWRGTSDSTDVVVFMLLTIAAGAGTLFVQYQRRSWIRSVSFAVLAVTLAVGAGSQWSWPLIRGADTPPVWAGQRSTLRLTGDSNDVRVAKDPYSVSMAPGWTLTAGLRLLAIPEGWSADVRLEEARVTLADGTHVKSGTGYYYAGVRAGDDRFSGYSAVLKQMGVTKAAHATADYFGPTILSVSDGAYRQLDRQTVRYEGRFELTLEQNEISNALPLRIGEVSQRGAYRIAIDRIALLDGAPSVLVRESDAHSIFERQRRGLRSYYLRNRERSEALPLTRIDTFRRLAANSARVMPFVAFADSTSGFTAGPMMLQFTPNPNIDAAIDADWLEGAELIVVVSTYRGAVDRTLEIDRLTIPGIVLSRSDG